MSVSYLKKKYSYMQTAMLKWKEQGDCVKSKILATILILVTLMKVKNNLAEVTLSNLMKLHTGVRVQNRATVYHVHNI